MESDLTTGTPAGDENFFYASYMQIEHPVVRQVRRAAFGEDIGQFGWTTADEMRRFARTLELGPTRQVLDVACGSGGPALFLAHSTGCRVTGVDITTSGIQTATGMAAALHLSGQALFQQADAAAPLPFADSTFDAILCIDAMNHFLDRVNLLREWHRVLRPGGRILFTNPIVVTGLLEREEIITRSGAMGRFVFTPPGLDEQFIAAAGFAPAQVEDVTDNIALVSGRWHQARAQYAAELREVEGQAAYDSFQNFLAVVHTLSSERRLSRLLYVARKAG
jgi:SAM-dependent methyltransferase